jgi:acetylglutamate kinase
MIKPSGNMLDEQIAKAAVLVEALPYMQGFRGQTFVIKVGGSAMENAALVEKLLRDVVFLEAVGVNPILVHGGGKAISEAMKAQGLEAKFIGGLRITDEAAISLVAQTLGQEINPGLVRGIEKYGGRASGVPGPEVFVGERTTTWCPELKEEVDLGFVGKVVDFNVERVAELVAGEIVPVVSPLAREKGTGEVLNVNADVAAAALAGRMGAAKLIFLSDVLGVMRDPAEASSLIHTVARTEVETLIEGGTISGGMIPKVRSSVDALNAGVGKVHLIDGRISHSLLLEVFTDEGIGTEITGEED